MIRICREYYQETIHFWKSNLPEIRYIKKKRNRSFHFTEKKEEIKIDLFGHFLKYIWNVLWDMWILFHHRFPHCT